MAWDSISPHEPRRQDLRVGILAANVMSMLNRGTSYRPKDFMPVEQEPEPPQTETELKSILTPLFGRLSKMQKGA